jgi:glycosyltransferase involved in cell wall biosynthesis
MRSARSTGHWRHGGASENRASSISQGGRLVRIVALVESVDHVCCRYRVAAFRDAFAAAGHEFHIRPLPRTPLARLLIGREIDGADAVVVQRKLLPSWVVALLRRRARRLIFDFDDAVWLRDSYSPRGFDDHRRARRFRAMMSACDLVVAGNEYLANEAARHTPRERVVVIPTCVEPQKYPTHLARSRSGLQLVWIGSHSTLRGLERFEQVLSAIGRDMPGTRLKLICDRFIRIAGLPIDECVWSDATEAAEIAAADVGISWVPDDPWSRGKCGLKVLQYQAAGLPVIANPVGVHTEMVRPNETGFTATTTEEWVAAVSQLAADPSLRRRLGQRARHDVEERFSVAAGARRWLSALEQFVQPVRKSG